MTCPFCGKTDNPARAKFCSHCGTALLTGSMTGAAPAGPAGNFDERFSVDPQPFSPASPPEPRSVVTLEMFVPWRRPDPAPVSISPESIVAASHPPSLPAPEPPCPTDHPRAASAVAEDDSEAKPLAPPAGEPLVSEPIAAATAASSDPDPENGPAATGSEPPPGGCRWDGTIPPTWVASPSVASQPASSRYWATGAHASAFVGAWLGGIPAFVGAWLGGIPAFVGPLIVWLVRKDSDPFAAEHGRNALNFNLSVIVYVVGMIVFSIFTFGLGLLVTIPGLILLGLAWFALTLIGTIKAASSETYQYPLTIRFIR